MSNNFVGRLLQSSDVPCWDDALEGYEPSGANAEPVLDAYNITFSKYNPTPGTGRTGFCPVPPNNYPFYNEKEKYSPVIQADGGQLSEWSEQYNPTDEEAEEDRKRAYEAGVPHGYVQGGKAGAALEGELMELWVVSDLHDQEEYGERKDNGKHIGGPFKISVSPGIRICDLRLLIRDKGGIIPALQKLSYAGKHLDDPQRTLEHYGVRYWHQRFPHWPIKIRKY